VQSISTGSFVFGGFFSANLVSWIAAFGSLFSSTQNTVETPIMELARGIYYFGFIGGLLSLVWELIALIMGSIRSLQEKSELKNKDNASSIIKIDNAPVKNDEMKSEAKVAMIKPTEKIIYRKNSKTKQAGSEKFLG
jgi:hypothetical protein